MSAGGGVVVVRGREGKEGRWVLGFAVNYIWLVVAFEKEGGAAETCVLACVLDTEFDCLVRLGLGSYLPTYLTIFAGSS